MGLFGLAVRALLLHPGVGEGLCDEFADLPLGAPKHTKGLLGKEPPKANPQIHR